MKPIVVVAMVSFLVGGMTLVANVWMGSFESLRADTRDGNARLAEEIKATDVRLSEEINQRIGEVKEEVKAGEARVRDELKASKARQAQEAIAIMKQP